MSALLFDHREKQRPCFAAILFKRNTLESGFRHLVNPLLHYVARGLSRALTGATERKPVKQQKRTLCVRHGRFADEELTDSRRIESQEEGQLDALAPFFQKCPDRQNQCAPHRSRGARAERPATSTPFRRVLLSRFAREFARNRGKAIGHGEN